MYRERLKQDPIKHAKYKEEAANRFSIYNFLIRISVSKKKSRNTSKKSQSLKAKSDLFRTKLLGKRERKVPHRTKSESYLPLFCMFACS